MAEPKNISQLLADFACSLKAERIPQSALHVMQMSILDWVSVSVCGQHEPVSKIVRKMAIGNKGEPEAFCIGSSVRLPAVSSALVNGTISHALDYDDTHFIAISHPSVAVIPAALAIADKVGASAKEFQTACLIGVEIACRMGAWLGRDHYRTGFHITSTSGTFGAAAAAASLLKLDQNQTATALNIAASRASGVKAQFGTMGKPYHAGMAASSGVECALLARGGFVAAEDAINGSQGYSLTHHGEENWNAFDGLGEVFVFEQVSHKFHACCHGIHAAVEALMILQDQQAFSLENIETIEIKTHPQWLNVCNIAKPKTGLEIKFSYAMEASLFLHGFDTAKLETYVDELCHRPDLIALSELVRVTGDDTISETGSTVVISIKNGETISADYDLTQLTGINEREAKILSKSESLLGKEIASSLWKSIQTQSELPSVYLEKLNWRHS